jgi:hypothetical protein
MSVPANIVTELQFLQAQVAAVGDLRTAEVATVTAMELNATNLLLDIDTALATAAGSTRDITGAFINLDTWLPPIDVGLIVSDIQILLVCAQDQTTLSTMRGVVGRASVMLNNLAWQDPPPPQV